MQQNCDAYSYKTHHEFVNCVFILFLSVFVYLCKKITAKNNMQLKVKQK